LSYREYTLVATAKVAITVKAKNSADAMHLAEKVLESINSSTAITVQPDSLTLAESSPTDST
jgi:hypothetical protein